MTVWLIRHGVTVAASGVAIGWSDVELAPEGRRRAEILARELASTPIRRVRCSDLKRARETAEIVALPHRLTVDPTPDLREIDFGSWEGRALGDLWVDSPAEAQAWESDLRQLPSGFGESFVDFEARVGRVAAQLRQERAETVVVAHRGSLSVIRAILTGISMADAWAQPCELGSIHAVAAATA